MRITLIVTLFMCLANLAGDYQVETLDNEYRLYCNEHHFLSLITDYGVCAIRPHPGNDVNGWGSTLYMQPFLPGAILGHTIIENINANDEGVYISCTGLVSYGETGNWGDWDSELTFTFSVAEKLILGIGDYNIQLTEELSALSGDLNLYKIASNYLYDVPLLESPYWGDTGDMEYAEVYGSDPGFPLIWNPVENPGYFPGFVTDSLSVYVSGQYNNIDTAAQGYEPIEPAWKPSLSVTLDSEESAEMVFGAIYDLELASEFWSDNIGITPLILNDTAQTGFNFTFCFASSTDEPEVYVTEDFISDGIEFTLYPNPLILSGKNARNELTLHIDNNDRNTLDDLLLGIYNIKGQVIKDNIFLDPSDNEIIISSNYFQQPGVYLIKFKTSGITEYRKLIVLR
ncbi:MAG: T9SS type A sorting domain-containing protein [Candidatus Cloacimonetes bacterium]|nr:T9SS type A sorting domain-containing protein [Candidatus Cloacimonadota bacterium]